MKVLFIQTGGTIDKAYPKTNDGYAFEIDQPAFERVLERVHPGFEYDTISLLQKDSLDLTEEDRQLLKQHIEASEYSKLIVTHGSDTLPDTASFVGHIKNKTIVFTGSYVPESFKGSDADFNLGFAIGTAMSKPEGTFICMNGMVFDYDNCRKNEENGKFEKINE